MKIRIDGTTVLVESEGELVVIKSESQLLHHIKIELNKQGYDLIKRLMWKDGHMVSDTQHYLRSRRKDRKAIAIYDTEYAIRDLAKDFRRDGRVMLTIVEGIWR